MNKKLYTIAILFGISFSQETFATKNKTNEQLPAKKTIESIIKKNRKIYKKLAHSPKKFNEQLMKDFTYEEMYNLEIKAIKWMLQDPNKSNVLAQKMRDESKSSLTPQHHYQSINKVIIDLEDQYKKTSNHSEKEELERQISHLMPVLFMAEQKCNNNYTKMPDEEIKTIIELTEKTFEKKK